MVGGNEPTQALEPNAASAPQISKRKPESPPLNGSDDPRRMSKTARLEQNQNSNLSHDPSADNVGKDEAVDKGKAKVIVQDEEKESDNNHNHNTSVLVHKGKGKMMLQEEEAKKEQKPEPSPRAFVDKGKGKMIVEEEEDSSDDSGEPCAASGSDSDYSDDPLMEVDLNNILPSRTRHWAPPVPGAYLVPPDQDEDEDDDDDDASDDGVLDDDDDDDDRDDVDESESE